MSISCDCSINVDDCPELYREEYPIARKLHKCCECGGEIRPGQRYHRFTGKWEHVFDTFKTCIPCDSIRNRFAPHGSTFGGLAEQIEECLGFDYREAPED